MYVSIVLIENSFTRKLIMNIFLEYLLDLIQLTLSLIMETISNLYQNKNMKFTNKLCLIKKKRFICDIFYFLKIIKLQNKSQSRPSRSESVAVFFFVNKNLLES